MAFLSTAFSNCFNSSLSGKNPVGKKTPPGRGVKEDGTL
jgi:hypothetical protein